MSGRLVSITPNLNQSGEYRHFGLEKSSRPCRVANRATLPKKWLPPPRNVADSCKLTCPRTCPRPRSACLLLCSGRVSVSRTHPPVFYLKDTATSLLFSPTILSGPGAILRCALPENMSAPAKCPPERGVRHVTTQVLRICTRRVSTRMLPCSGGVLVWRTHPPAFCSKDTPTSLLIEGHTRVQAFSLAPRPPSVPASRHEGLDYLLQVASHLLS